MATHIADTHVSLMVALREHENFHSVVHPFAGVCLKSGKALMQVRLAWDEEVVSSDSYDGKRRAAHGWTHQVNRHTDGSYCETPVWDKEAKSYHPTETQPENCMGQAQCPKCHQYNMTDVTMEAYGNRTKCRNPRCDYEHYYSIGD